MALWVHPFSQSKYIQMKAVVAQWVHLFSQEYSVSYSGNILSSVLFGEFKAGIGRWDIKSQMYLDWALLENRGS